MIAKANKLKSKILDIKYGRVKAGLKINIPEIDEHIRFKKNLLITIGHANVGKTTTLIYFYVLWAKTHNLKFVIWSSENSPESILRKIIEFKMDKPIQEAHDDLIEKAINWANEHFKIIDVEEMYTYKELLKEAQSIKDAWGYDGLLIDPYNSLAKDASILKMVGNSHEYDYQVLTELRMFTKKNNVQVCVNAHGVSSALRQVHHSGHEYEGLTRPLAMSDAEGGSKISSRADDIWCIHRYVQHPTEWMYSHIHVQKIKETETGGRPTSFEVPMKLKMSTNNVGFEFMGKNILHNEKSDINETLKF
ncbi:MAG: hypothetical protein ABF265_01805 [Polaribacter sp.]